MKFISTPIAGCIEVEFSKTEDERGTFQRQFCSREFAAQGILYAPVQSNLSQTTYAGTVRGLHYQIGPYFESKFLRVLRGKIFDVCVDLRLNSKTFGLWHSVELSAEKCNGFLLPKGCAHGFQSLVDDCQVIYFHDQYYTPDADRSANILDPLFDIRWPLPISLISAKDKNAPMFDKKFKGYDL